MLQNNPRNTADYQHRGRRGAVHGLAMPILAQIEPSILPQAVPAAI
jgi:hypothetical protein